MPTCTVKDYRFPPMPLSEWTPTRETLHLFVQIVGKIRMALHPKLNHWWHVTLYPSARGLNTEKIPYCGREFEIEFDFIHHQLQIRTSDGDQRDFPLIGLSVAEFYRQTMYNLLALGIDVQIEARPYQVVFSTIPFEEDQVHHTYDPAAAHQYWRILSQISSIFEEFRGRFVGKSTPVQVFWHSFDLALTRFSGKVAPPREGVNPVEREAYSHEVISFGFWPGDASFPEPAFYSYTYPAPSNLTQYPLKPESAYWGELHGSPYAFWRYEDMRQSADPKAGLLEFLESAYQAGAQTAGWPVENLAMH